MTQATFDKVNEDHLGALLETAPDVGTLLGLPQRDDQWPDPSESGRAASLAVVSRWASALVALPEADLTEAQQLDREVFTAHAALVKFAHESLHARHHDADVLTPVSWTLLRQLQGTHVAAEQRFLNLAGRLRGLGSYLEAARSVVTTPDALWMEVARDVAQEAGALVAAVVQSARAADVSVALKEDVEVASHAAMTAVSAHQAWLRDLAPAAGNHWQVGRERFEELCRLRGLPSDVPSLLEMGQRYVAECHAERGRWARRLLPGKPMEEALALLVSDPPATFEEGLERVKRASAEARAFVHDRGLALMPAGEELLVLETPAPLRPLIPFAALLPAPRFSPEQRSVYLVTPPLDGGPLRDFCTTDVENTAIHEGYPGHHLQQTFASTSTGLLRDGVPLGHFADPGASWATETVEGWAHYCEEMMRDEGYRPGAAARLQTAKDALWRAHRVVIDVQLSTGGMTVDQAVERLTRGVGMAPRAARAEVHRYTRSPGYPMCYLLGKELIFGLRHRAKLAWREAYSTRRFHDLVLSSGNIPMKWLGQRLTPTATSG
jgi:uncharacterized protein (DUF885 family)